MSKKTTPEKPPTPRELSIAGKTLTSKAPAPIKTLAGRVLSEGRHPSKGGKK
jgi:hypothetical protein